MAASHVAWSERLCYGRLVSISTACANIALVKYWGKRERALNLPAAGSLSLTLDALRTWTEVSILDAKEDELVLDGVGKSGRALARVSEFLDIIRSRSGRTDRARVVSKSSFPVAAGLASSASGFAALAVAAADAFGLDASADELSELARIGSGSAARSIHGGFVQMSAGSREDGKDAIARPIEGSKIELSAAVAVAHSGEKEIASRDGMELTKDTSPYHESWIALVDRDLASAKAALATGDFDRLAEVTEGSCLAMHANAMSARPGIIYFEAPTLWAINRVRSLRKSGVPVMFTIDAGPHVVAMTPPAHLSAVASALSEIEGIERVISSSAGEGAHIIDAFPGAPA